MCKTCLKKGGPKVGEEWGPWGLSGAYTSATRTSNRLHHARSHCQDQDEKAIPKKEAIPKIVIEDTEPLWTKAKVEPRPPGSPSLVEEFVDRSFAFSNVLGGGLLAHTDANPHLLTPSQAYREVGAVEGTPGSRKTPQGTFRRSKSAEVSSTSDGDKIRRGVKDRSAAKVNADEIAKDAPAFTHDSAGSDGRQIATGSTPQATTSADDGKLDSSEARPRPFFFLPSEDDEESVENELLKDPDLYPVPKTHPDTLSLSLPSLASPPPPASSSSKPTSTPTTPPTPCSKPSSNESVSEIQSRIRSCLQRARNRRSSSSSLCNLGSFEAGLYRLEGLLEGEGEGRGYHSLPYHSLDAASHGVSGHVKAPMKSYADAETITDVCTGENVAEVEIIRLVQEAIPKYKLRADTITEFSGYDNADWGVTFPALKEEEVEALSPEQAEGALAYFVLCGNRVSQMTKTYNDIDAVTRLLQEKEKDLELAAKIGQQLLNRNKTLEERNASLEAEVSSAGDKITQLKHDLQMKTDLLQIYTNDVEDPSSCENTPTGVRLIHMDILHHRVQNLEDENKELRQEASQLACDTMEVEAKEKELVTDVIKQLSDANLQVRQLSEELAKKVEDSLRQQEEITHLLAQLVDLQSKNKRIVLENEELGNMVGVARECQQELTSELADLKEKYAEVLDLLHDTQDQLRRAQRKTLPGSRGHHLSGSLYGSPFNSGNDSIANELHSLNSIGEEMGKPNSTSMRRTFDTVRLTGKHPSAGSHGSLSSLGYGGSIHSTPTHHAHTPHMATPTHMSSSGGTYAMSYMGSRGSSVYSGGSGHPSLDSGAESDSMHTDSEDNYPGSHIGVPGWPGTPDLDSCLRRLGPGERSQFLPYGCRTPDSIMSTGSSKSGLSMFSSGNSQDWKLPQKLQIVKPIEGSLTLHQWSRLATPHLGGLLEEREGVAIKGGTGTEHLNLDIYSMSDLEEDEPEEEHPGKRFMNTSGVFTYTNSTILHPDDQTALTPSLRQSQVSILPTSTYSSTTPSTPIRAPSCPPSRRGSTATFSCNTGLAKVLNERGMNTTNIYSPTATPANSPSGSRPSSPEPEGYKLPGLEDLTKTFHYGASLLRRTFYKSDPSAPGSPTGPQVNLVEQVQALGVDHFVGSSGRALTVGGVVTSRPATSPLLHLSNLIMSSAKTTTTSTVATTTVTAYTSTTQSRAGLLSSAPKVLSPGERKPSFPSAAPIGIPGHPGSGHLDNRLSQLKPGQRSDLGTVGGRARPTSLGSVPGRPGAGEQNVGTVGWMSFGRKGGLL